MTRHLPKQHRIPILWNHGIAGRVRTRDALTRASGTRWIAASSPVDALMALNM